jgi:hypothetical protein
MAAINIDYSSLPFSDLERNDRYQHGASDFEMQQVPASRFVCTPRATTKTDLTLAGLQVTFLRWQVLVERVTTNKTLW